MRDSRTTSGRASSSASERRRTLRPALVGLALFAAACGPLPGFGGCSRPITYVDIVDRTEADPSAPAKVDRPGLERAIQAMMADLPDFAFRAARDGETAWQLRVTVQQLTERLATPEEASSVSGGPGLVRSVGISLELFALSGRSEDPAEVSAPRRFEADRLLRRTVAAGAPFDPLVQEAVAEAGRDLAVGLRLAESDDDALLEALSSSDPRQQGRAAVLAGQRRLRAAVPRLTPLLKEDAARDDVVLRAIGALVAIGDPGAVPALIEAGRMRPPEFLTPLLYAIGALGGREAEAYLFTVLSGHPDEALRQVAREALRELERRQGRAPKQDPSEAERPAAPLAPRVDE
jgi:hypothetical protein